jgi:glycosyltransferase involved in cell wall biosynthesis
LKPNLSFAAVLTTIASDADLEKAVNALENLGCLNLDVLLLDPFLGASKISFETAMENLNFQLEELRCRGVIVLSPFEKHKSVFTFPFSIEYKQVGILYDLIPLQFSQDFLISRNQISSYAWSLQNLSKFHLLLAISTETKNAWKRQVVSKSRVKVIYGGGHLRQIENTPRFKNRSGVLCVSAEQPHKNLSLLIESYCLLPEFIQLEHALTIVGIRSSGARKKFAKLGRGASGKIVLTEYLNEAELKDKYRESRLLVMPSLIEGLSLPILEAWRNGLVAVGSKGTVAEELLEDSSLLFDPFSSVSISDCMKLFLTSEEDWSKAFEVSMLSAACFTWEATAKLAIKEIESLLDG